MKPEQDRLEQLATEVHQLKRKSLVFQTTTLILIAIIFGYGFFSGKQTTFERITAREIIVQDQNGNDRIILSSQIGATDSRQRNDTLEGILILDEHGTDRVALGATPTIEINGQIVRRVNNGNPYGFAFNDKDGTERGGFGFYDDRGLVSFGMDSRAGEGLTMFVADENLYGQKVGMVMQTERGQVVYLGSNVKQDAMLNLDVPDKGRLSIQIDSSAHASISSYNYRKNSSEVLVESK